MSLVDRLSYIGLRIHQAIYERTDGRLGHRLILVPSLLLRTKGRRTGRTRTAALIYAKDGGGFVLVASNHGSGRPPGWLANVEARPEVEVQLGRRRLPATARIVSAADPDHARLWALVNANNRDRYRGYQHKTWRPIPIVVVTPVDVRAHALAPDGEGRRG